MKKSVKDKLKAKIKATIKQVIAKNDKRRKKKREDWKAVYSKKSMPKHLWDALQAKQKKGR